MMVKVFSKYLFFSVGGAEKSMQQYLNKNYSFEDEVVLFGAENIKNFNSDNFRHDFPKNYQIKNIIFPWLFSRFPYLEYCMNRKSLKSYFKKLDHESELLTYGIYAPIAVIAYRGEATFFLRSESDLCINNNYHNGIKKVLKGMYKLFEFPFFNIYKKDIKEAVRLSNVICNSKWMQDQLQKRFNKKSIVEFPEINLNELQFDFELLPKKKRGVVFIGDNISKGSDIVLKMADLLPHITFYIFGRNNSDIVVEGNKHYMSWEADLKKVYQYADLVVVPSICYEAFGRVSIEAQALGIPVLVSKRGGLCETVNHDSRFIVNDYKNPEEWSQRIEKLLAHDQN